MRGDDPTESSESYGNDACREFPACAGMILARKLRPLLGRESGSSPHARG